MTSKTPEIEKALKKVTDASGKVIVEQEKLNALRDKGNATDVQMIAQSEKLRKAHADEAAAISVVNRALDDHSNKTRKFGDDVSNAAAKVGDLGGALRGLGAVGALGALPAVATAITSVAGALQQLSGAALAGPGIFAGIAASAGTAALGMQGMSDAFDASIKALDGTKTHVEAANKALAQISPAAADAVKGVVGLKGTFDSLRDVAATNMFQGFSGNLRSLVSADLPVLTRGIDGISKGLGQNLTQVLSSLGSSSSQGFLDRILGNTGNAQGKLTAAIDPIVHAVGVLTAAGSDTLPRLADAVGAVADRFNAFITTADANGNLAKWIDQGLTGFRQLGETVLNIGKIFTDLTAAAGGGTGLLGTLESATGKLHDFLSSTEGQTQLREYFAQGRDMLGQLLEVAKSAGPVLAGMFNAASSTTRTLLPIIQSVLDVINSIPGGAEAVVTAFVAWKTITGVAALVNTLGAVSTLLRVTLPADAAVAGTGIAAGLSKALPVVGQIMAAFAIGQQNPAITPGVKLPDGTTAPDIAKDGIPDLTPLKGGGGQFGPSAADRWVAADQAAHPTGGSNAPGTYRRRDGSIGTLPSAAGAPANTPGLSSYSDPVVTSGGGGGTTKPFIDPSKWAGGDPLAGMPAAVAGADPEKIYEADSRLITATNDLAQKKLALQVLEAQGNASQQELLTAKNNVLEQERALYTAQQKDIEARTNQMKQSTSDLQSIFAPLDQDFGVSKGIPGIVENLTKMFGNMALASAVGSSPTLQSAAMSMMSSNGGSPGAGYGGALGFPGAGFSDAALLSNVPGGRYSQTGSADLTQGLADCSSAVEDLVNLMDGNSTAGRSMSTGNAAQWLPAHGFLPGEGGPGDFRVGYNSGHMQATLPGGTPFNWGSDAAAAAGGVGGTGADDPAFTSHYYRPVAPGMPVADPYAPSPSALGPAPLGGGNGAPSPTGWTSPGIPASTTGGAGQGPILGSAPKGPGAGASAGFNTGIAPQGGGGPGLQLGGAGFDGAMMAAGALDLMAPGAGQAAQIGIKLGKRAIEYGGQVAGIAASGVAETFLPSGSALGNFGNSWFGKIAGGVAGARPAKDNMAGKAGATPPQQGGPGQGGQGGTVDNSQTNHITMTQPRDSEDRAGADLVNHLSTQNSSPGPGNPRG